MKRVYFKSSEHMQINKILVHGVQRRMISESFWWNDRCTCQDQSAENGISSCNIYAEHGLHTNSKKTSLRYILTKWDVDNDVDSLTLPKKESVFMQEFFFGNRELFMICEELAVCLSSDAHLWETTALHHVLHPFLEKKIMKLYSCINL